MVDLINYLKTETEQNFDCLKTESEIICSTREPSITCKKCLRRFQHLSDFSIHCRLVCRNRLTEFIEDRFDPEEPEKESDADSVNRFFEHFADGYESPDLGIPTIKEEPQFQFEQNWWDESDSLNKSTNKGGSFNELVTKRNKLQKKLTNAKKKDPVCSICDKRFAHYGTLQVHLQTHGNTVYTCELCGFQTLVRRSLVSHMRHKHMPKEHVSRN